MALTTVPSQTPSIGLPARSAWPAAVLCLGLALVYLGERALEGTVQLGVDAVGLGCIALSLVGAGVRAARGPGAQARVYRSIARNFLVAALGVGLYGCLRFSLTPPAAWVNPERALTVLRAAFVPIVLWGLLPALAQERAAAGMAGAAHFELWRVHAAARAARITLLGVFTFATVNYAANIWNRKIDLTYFKTTRASDATLDLIRGLSVDVEATLFFPSGNEVLEQAKAYLEPLATQSPRFVVQVTDQALEPDKARTLRVRGNGTLALAANGRSELIRLELDLEAARATLRGLDGKVQERLIKLLRPGRVAYLTTGHNERDLAPQQDDSRAGLAELKSLLEHQGFAVRRLGLTEGLGKAVPQDATLVVVAGPIAPFSEMERTALHTYVQQGGHVLVALDPDHGSTEDALLLPWGLRCSKALVGHDKFLVRVPGRRESPYDLITNRVGNHPVTQALLQTSGRMGVVLLGAGSLSRVGKPHEGDKVEFVLHAMPGSFLDKAHKGAFDGDPASRSNLEFAATFAQPGHDGDPEARVVVLADVDALSDGVVLAAPGNTMLAMDALVWLGGEAPGASLPQSEEDVPLVHRKQDDALWFYGVSFAMPALVLSLGYFATRRRKRARQGTEVAGA